jgi:hypothetical protein
MQGVSQSNLIVRLHHPVLGPCLAASQAGHSRNYVSQPSSEIRVVIVSYETRDRGTRRGPIDAGEVFGLRVVLVGGRTEVQDSEQVAGVEDFGGCSLIPSSNQRPGFIPQIGCGVEGVSACRSGRHGLLPFHGGRRSPRNGTAARTAVTAGSLGASCRGWF